MATVIRGSDNFDTADNATQTELNSGLAGKLDSAPGRVLQVKSYTLLGTVTGTNTGSAVDTGLSVSITPSSTSSKILVTIDLGSFTSLATGHWGAGRLHRNGSVISGALSTSNTNTNYGNLDGYSKMWASVAGRYRVTQATSDGTQLNHSVKPVSFSYLDSPSSTSAQTYALYAYARPTAGSWGLNITPDSHTAADHAVQGISTITVMEVAG